MKQSISGSSGDSVVVYGSTGFVGRIVCHEAQNAGYSVISLGRTKCRNSSESIEIDYSSYNYLLEATADLLLRDNLPKAFIFCHRSRVSPQICDADALLLSTIVEINPYHALKEALIKTRRNGALNIVTVTSNAAFRYAEDVHFNYHIIKHAQVAASIGLSMIPSSLHVFSNVVSFGEIINTERKEHDLHHKRLFAWLSRCSLNKSVPSINDLARAVITLCKADSMGICGQILTVDSGLSCLTQEFLVRSLYAKS